MLLLSCQTLGRVIGTEAAGSAAVWVEPWDCIAPTQLRVYLDGELVGFSPIYYTYYTVRAPCVGYDWLALGACSHCICPPGPALGLSLYY